MGMFIGPMVEIHLKGEDPANSLAAVREIIDELNLPYGAELYSSEDGERHTLIVEYRDRIRNLDLPIAGSAVYLPMGLDLDDERLDPDFMDLIDQTYLVRGASYFETMIVTGRLG